LLREISYLLSHLEVVVPSTLGEHLEIFAKRWTLHSLSWAFCGSAPWDARKVFSDMLLRTSGIMIPDSASTNLFDYKVRVSDGEYELWSDNVPRMEIESHRVASSDVVITTTDTVRHSDVLQAWLDRRIPLVLCGYVSMIFIVLWPIFSFCCLAHDDSPAPPCEGRLVREKQ
jgi:hypothetical protein